MKREILFRGKRIDNGEWVYGYLREIWSNSKPRFTISPAKRFENNGWVDTDEIEVTPKTIGQFTGLTDKNGAKVFEGDIINTRYPYRYFVGYENGQLYAYHSEIKDVDRNPYRWGLVSRLAELEIKIEVVGNIHDNPELLK